MCELTLAIDLCKLHIIKIATTEKEVAHIVNCLHVDQSSIFHNPIHVTTESRQYQIKVVVDPDLEFCIEANRPFQVFICDIILVEIIE
jgi:hypothetical protein